MSKEEDEFYESGCEDTEHALIWLLKNKDIKEIYKKEIKKG